MKKLTITLLIFLTVITCVSCGIKKESPSETNIDPNITQMRAICELATLKCYYHNVAKYSDTDVSGFLFWKKDRRFWIEYSGIVTMGIDASALDIKISGNTVTITMPEAKILSTKVDESSLTQNSFFIDSNSAKVDVESTKEAISHAEKEMLDTASKDTSLLATAQQRAQTLLEDYVNNLGNSLGKQYHIEWKIIEAETTN